MEKEHSHGLIIDNTSENILKIRKKVMANSNGLTEDVTEEIGWMVYNMVKVRLFLKMELKDLENGKKERGSNGSIVLKIKKKMDNYCDLNYLTLWN